MLVNREWKPTRQTANFRGSVKLFNEEFPKLSIRSRTHYDLGLVLNKRKGISNVEA